MRPAPHCTVSHVTAIGAQHICRYQLVKMHGALLTLCMVVSERSTLASPLARETLGGKSYSISHGAAFTLQPAEPTLFSGVSSTTLLQRIFLCTATHVLFLRRGRQPDIIICFHSVTGLLDADDSSILDMLASLQCLSGLTMVELDRQSTLPQSRHNKMLNLGLSKPACGISVSKCL